MPTCSWCARLPEGWRIAASTAWPKKGRGSTCHKVFGLYSSASILPGLVMLGNQVAVWDLRHPRPPTFSSGCWRLEINERSCQGELRKRHSGAGQRGVGQGAKLKVVHKSVL